VFSEKRIKLFSIQTELGNIVQTSEESQVFLYEKSVYLKKKVFKSLGGVRILLSTPIDCKVLLLWWRLWIARKSLIYAMQ